nr:ribosomal protein L7Ae/L30e/S12e/Gadd45 [Tanacetum cinerariifolium]
LRGHRDHLSASLAHMLYCIIAEEQYNLAYFFVKRIECAWATPNANLPYRMFLTRLFQHVMEHYPHLDNGIYNVVDKVMLENLEAIVECLKPITLSHYHSPIIMDLRLAMEMAMKMMMILSTPSPTTYLNSLSPLNYEKYDIPTSSQQDDDLLFERQTTLLKQTQQIHEEVRDGFKSFGKAL